MSDYTQEDLELLEEVFKDPKEWIETFINNPEDTNHGPIVLNYAQNRIIDSLKAGNKRILIRVHRRAGKMAPLYSTVYTPDGPVTMGSLKIGSTVCTPDGEIAKVTGIFPQGVKDIYRIHLDDGTYVEAGDEHLWEVFTGMGWKGGRGKSRKQYGNKVLTTKEIMEDLTYSYNNRTENKYKLNPVSPILHTQKDIPIDPYLLGVLLGDGHMNTRTITSDDEDIIRTIEQRTGLEISRRDPENRTTSYYVKNLNCLKALSLDNTISHNKFIPKEYLYNSIENRLWLLRGLMDTDGSSDKRRNGQAEFCSVSKQLAEDTAELCRSLGCKVKISESEAGYTKNGTRKVTGVRFRLNIRVPEGLEIFNLDRKKCGGLPTRYLRRTIVKIEKVGSTEMQCIMVDHPRELYLTDNYTPTHNTHALSAIALWAAVTRPNFKVLVVCPDKPKALEIYQRVKDFINVSPVLGDMVARLREAPYLQVSFKNGSMISGFTTGASSNRKATAVRSQTADLVIIDEAAYLADDEETKGDWPAITPIMEGDSTRKPISIVSSTPQQYRGTYYKWATENQDTIQAEHRWDRIHIGVDKNPEWNDEKIQSARALSANEAMFTQEYLAEFPDVGEGVFRNSYIDRAAHSYNYLTLTDTIPPAIYTMGVDWDKYQAGPTILILKLEQELKKYMVAYCEEVDQSEYVLIDTIQKIIKLNELFNPRFIYIDRGYGEVQCELLRKYGEENPSSNLSNKIKGITFSDRVEIFDPVDGKVSKPIKPFMVNTVVRWFEDNSFIYSKNHVTLTRQLESYRVVATTANSIKYSSRNEHIIDALLLAAHAMHTNFADPFKVVATEDYVVKPTKEFFSEEPEKVPGMIRVVKDDYSPIRPSFGRKLPSYTGFTRKGF